MAKKQPKPPRSRICHMCGGIGMMQHGDSSVSCMNCGATISYGRGRALKKIEVHGTDHAEVSQVARDLTAGDTHGPLLTLITQGTFWVGALLAVLGVVLVAIGATGDTTLNFFGQSLRSQNVGIAALFLGAALIVLNIRRLLKSVDRSRSAK